jgi:hypothetical protein
MSLYLREQKPIASSCTRASPCVLIGVLCCNDMDMCGPPDLGIVVRAIPQWAGSYRQQPLHASVLYDPLVPNMYVQGFCTAPLDKESRLCAELRIPH